jgi:hypothetical protein
MSIVAVFEKLGSRLRQRTTSAQETIEKSAQALAAGESVDTGAVEAALVTAGVSLDDYRARVDFHVERKTRLDELDKLGAARTELEGLDKRIEAENKKHSEIVDAYRKRWVALREQADEASRQVERSRSARDWLLDPARAPLHLRDDYVAALDVEQKARERIGDVERSIRDLKDRHKSEEGWISQILAEDVRMIHAPSAVVTKNQRDKLTGAQATKLEEHERRRDRYARELAQAEKDLEAARADLVTAEAVVADIRKRILKT